MASRIAACSISSTTTRGGCTFEMLCNGSVQSYACDNLVDITRTEDIEHAVRIISKHLDRCVQSIETERGKLKQFYIGKTHVRKKKGKRAKRFNHMTRPTWRLAGGINGRFKEHRDAGYGRDGLVVLTVVTKEAIDTDIRRNKPNLHQEDYALGLESRLIQKYMKNDPRLANNTLATGGRDRSPSVGYPIYMAFEVEDSETSDSEDSTSESTATDQASDEDSDKDSDEVSDLSNPESDENGDEFDSSDTDEDSNEEKNDGSGSDEDSNEEYYEIIYSI